MFVTDDVLIIHATADDIVACNKKSGNGYYQNAIKKKDAPINNKFKWPIKRKTQNPSKNAYKILNKYIYNGCKNYYYDNY